MADDRQQLLSEAYRRGILPPDMKSAYEEAQKRNIVQGSEPSFGEEFLHGMADPVLGVAQMVSRGTGLGASAAAPRPGPSAPAEGVKTEQKVRPAEPEGMTAGRFLGNLVTGAGVGGAAASFVPRIITPMTRAVIAGGIGGVSQPVDPVKEESFWREKSRQLTEGAVLGYGLSVAGKGASLGLEKLGDFLVRKYPENIMTQAVGTVLKRIDQDSKYGAPTAQQMLDLVDAANQGGKPMAIADFAGKNLRSLGGHVARAPGESRQMAESFLTKRDEAAAERLHADVDRYVSSGATMFETTEALLSARSAASKPLYADTDKLQGVWSPRLQQFLENPDVARGMARGYHIERLNSLAEGRKFDPTMMGVDLDAEGNIKLLRTPNMRVLDMAKQGLDAMVAEERNELTGRLSSLGVALDRVRRAYVTELDGLDTSGVYRKAREAWSGPSASLDAMRAGRQAFGQSPEANQALVNDLSANDQEFARVGLADMLRERLGKAGFNSDESRALIRNPWMRDQMRPFFKSDKDFNSFVDSVSSENIMAKTKNDLLKGSQTAERLAEDESEKASTMASGARIARSLVEARFFTAIGEMWRLHRDVSRRPDPQLNEAIAKLMFAPDIAQTDLGRRLLTSPPLPVGNYLAGPAAAGQDIVAPAVAAGSGEAVR